MCATAILASMAGAATGAVLGSMLQPEPKVYDNRESNMDMAEEAFETSRNNNMPEGFRKEDMAPQNSGLTFSESRFSNDALAQQDFRRGLRQQSQPVSTVPTLLAGNTPTFGGLRRT